MRRVVIGLIFAAAGALTANATVIATFSSSGTGDNVLLNSGATGTLVQGIINGQPGVDVNFESTQVLSEPSNGQARVEAATGALNNINIFLNAGFGYTTLVFNPSITGGVGSAGAGTISVLTAEPGGAPNQTFTFTYPSGLGSGSNFVTLTASGGEQMIKTTFTAANGVADIRQVRLGGIAPIQQEFVIPEPGSLMLLSAGLVGLGLIRRRK